MFSVGSTQGIFCQNGQIPFAGATEVYEPPASTLLVLSANSFVGRNYEACSSIKMPDVCMLKRHRRIDLVQQHRSLYHPLEKHCQLGRNSTLTQKIQSLHTWALV